MSHAEIKGSQLVALVTAVIVKALSFTVAVFMEAHPVTWSAMVIPYVPAASGVAVGIGPKPLIRS